MKTILLTFLIFFQIPYISYSQGIENVDKLLGYKEFKFGAKPSIFPKTFNKTDFKSQYAPDYDYSTSDRNYNKFLDNSSNLFMLYLNKGILYKVEFWFRDSLIKERTIIGMQSKVDFLWKDLNKLFGEPNKPPEIEKDFLGDSKTYFWEGTKNIIEFVVVKEGEYLSLFIYDKKLYNEFKLSQFK